MADQEPPIVQQESTVSTISTESHASISSPDCPFCTIASNFPPTSLLSDLSNSNTAWNPEKLSPPAYVLLSTKDVVAFLDIAPLTKGHVLVAPRNHRVKVGDLRPGEMSEIGRVLPLIARAVLRTVLPDIPHAEADYNIVQNNGPGAAQVIPHVHFHIVPRPPLNYQPLKSEVRQRLLGIQLSPSPSTGGDSQPGKSQTVKRFDPVPKSKYPPNKFPTAAKRSYIQFGRGMRHELDDDEALVLVEEIRGCLAEEWRREFGSDIPNEMTPDGRPTDPTRNRRTNRSPEKL